MPSSPSRRTFLKSSAGVAAASALTSSLAGGVHAAEDNTVQVALVGCGGRGTGAAANALDVSNGPTKLVAMADVFDHRLNASYEGLKRYGNKMDVPDDRQFIGFDAYKKAMDALKPGDIVILTTPPAFRWVHFTYAIEKGLNVFMEKPVTVDGATSRRMLELNKKAIEKNLKVGVGLMCRHCDARGELFDRIQNGEMGDLITLHAYRVVGPTASAFSGKKPEGMSELMWQIERFHSFLWASGGAYSDFLIHNIDECCWMKNDWPVEAKALGGRHYRGNYVDQNFDTYSVEYTFADGAKMFLEGRCMSGCHNEFASLARGSKGSAIISTSGHSPAKPRIFKNQSMKRENIVWEYGKPERNPYQIEWDDLLDAVRNDKPYNEVERGVQASLVTAMGRLAAHTGQNVTIEETLNNKLDLGAGIDELTLESEAPVKADAEGKYPVPQPGLVVDREY